MGRTLGTFTELVAGEVERWAKFRRALRAEDQRALDALLASARHHAAAGAYASDARPFEVMVMAMMIELQKKVDERVGP